MDKKRHSYAFFTVPRGRGLIMGRLPKGDELSRSYALDIRVGVIGVLLIRRVDDQDPGHHTYQTSRRPRFPIVQVKCIEKLSQSNILIRPSCQYTALNIEEY